ncbi:MAG: hypothetical protein R3D28_13175 [Geminicoccaceae bacterium]
MQIETLGLLGGVVLFGHIHRMLLHHAQPRQRTDPPDRRLAHPVQDHRQDDDAEPGDQPDAELEVADAAQDQTPSPGAETRGRDHHHRQRHHDRLVDTGHDVGQGQGYLDAEEALARCHAEGIGRLEHVPASRPMHRDRRRITGTMA